MQFGENKCVVSPFSHNELHTYNIKDVCKNFIYKTCEESLLLHLALVKS